MRIKSRKFGASCLLINHFFMVYNEMEYMRNYISTFQVIIHILVDCKTSSLFNKIYKHDSFIYPPSYNKRPQTWLRILPDWSPISCTRSKIWKFQLFIFSISESWSKNTVSNVGLCSTCVTVRYFNNL